jgi:hypothetical protein
MRIQQLTIRHIIEQRDLDLLEVLGLAIIYVIVLLLHIITGLFDKSLLVLMPYYLIRLQIGQHLLKCIE